MRGPTPASSPRRSVTVVFEGRDNTRAYGVVANLSEGGACVWTDAHLKAGERVELAVSFARASRPVPAEARSSGPDPGAARGQPLRRAVGRRRPRAEHLRRLISEST